MSLGPGARLGPYEVVAAIGAGGMGEVYRARDTRLDRTVAIKILPSAIAGDPTFRERFDREARAVAALNHPHICTLHDIGEQDGTAFLVMEYLEGETLANRLAKGALPLDQALRYAIQIAEALDKAHRAGIVHRDLKPANIMLVGRGGPSGPPTAKLLDFGLAKTSPAVAFSSVSVLPTAHSPVTAQGTILGTLQYMAPEQVEGREADARSDIFAFGAIVYEMVTGKHAFAGKSQASVIAAILDRDPPVMSSLQPVTPRLLDHVVQSCLAKDADERWQSASDVMRELKWIAAAPDITTVRAVHHIGRREQLAWVMAVLLGLAIVAIVFAQSLRTATPPPQVQLDVTVPATTDPISFALSPDGQRIVFVDSTGGQPHLSLRPLDTVTAQSIAGTEGAAYPFWSPDGRSVGFFAGGKLKRVDIGGGLPQTLTDAAPRGGTWNTDGVVLFTRSTASPLFRIPASGGEAKTVTVLDKEASHRFPAFLPDGRRFVFFAQGTPDTGGIYVGALDSQTTTRLTPSDAAAAYANGWLFFIRSGTLMARRLDLTKEALEGDPIRVADITVDGSVNIGAFSVSPAGIVAYRTGGANLRQLVWFDRSGKALGTVAPPDENGILDPRLSPDGRRVSMVRVVQGNPDIWLLQDSTRNIRFTFEPSYDRYPLWSPDGSTILFDSNRKGQRDIYQKPSSGAGSETPLLESKQDKSPTDWSRDGRFVLYNMADPQTGWDVWALPLNGERKPFPFVKTNFDERRGRFSPDGRWVAYRSNESGRYEIYVRPFDPTDPALAGGRSTTSGGQWQVSAAGGIDPVWSADGTELYYLAADAKLIAVPIKTKGWTLEPGTPATLFQTRIVGGGTDVDLGTNYDVTSDGRFLIDVTTDQSTSTPITIVLNSPLFLQK